MPNRCLFAGIDYHTLGLLYIADLKGGKMEAQDVVTAAGFFGFDNLPFAKIGFKNVKESLIRLTKLYAS